MHELGELLTRHGVTLVFVNVLLKQLGLPLPAMPLLVVAGAFIADGDLGAPAVVTAGLIASLLADTPWYYAGRRYGYRVLGALCRIAIEPDSCVRQTENIFGRWGASSLSIAKFIPGFATVAPPLAGALKLPLPQFLLYSAVGGLLWVAAPVALGAVFSDEVEWVLDTAAAMGGTLATLAGLLLVLYLGVKLAKRYLLLRFLRRMRITGDQLAGLMTSEPRPVILDARTAAVRRRDPRRIPGAIPIDLEQGDIDLQFISPDRHVVVYCS